MKICRMRVWAALMIASSLPMPSSMFRRIYVMRRMPSMDETPNSEMKPMAAEILKFKPATVSPRIPPATAKGMPESASRLIRTEANRL